MTIRSTFAALLTVPAALALSGCALDGLGFGGPAAKSRLCETCTAANMGGSGFALPANGVVIYQGTVKMFDLERNTFSFIETDPPLMRPREARIVTRRDVPLSDADRAWATRTMAAAWSPPESPSGPPQTPRGCAISDTKNDGRLPALVVLIDQTTFFAERECGAEDASGQLSELTARADRIVVQRFPGIEPK